MDDSKDRVESPSVQDQKRRSVEHQELASVEPGGDSHGEFSLPRDDLNSASGPDDLELSRLALAADVELAKLVVAAGPDSPLAVQVREALKDLGIGTLSQWESSRVLFPRLKRMKILLPRPPTSFRTESRAIIYVSVHAALPPFMNEWIFGGRWDPERNPLDKCFLRACLVAFGREYRRYCGEERLVGGNFADYDDEIDVDERDYINQRPEPDPLARVMQREEIESLFQLGLEPRDLIIFIRISQGFTQAEIADELDLTEAAVSMRVRRTRRRIAEHRRTHDTDGATF